MTDAEKNELKAMIESVRASAYKHGVAYGRVNPSKVSFSKEGSEDCLCFYTREREEIFIPSSAIVNCLYEPFSKSYFIKCHGWSSTKELFNEQG